MIWRRLSARTYPAAAVKSFAAAAAAACSPASTAPHTRAFDESRIHVTGGKWEQL